MSSEYLRIPAREKPAVVTWFRAYSGCLCVLYLAVAAASLLFFLPDPADIDMSAAGARLLGVVFVFMGVGLFIACLIPLVVSPRSWLWTYDLVIIGLGLTSACLLPACIPLLIFWIRPETKEYFGKS